MGSKDRHYSRVVDDRGRFIFNVCFVKGGRVELSNPLFPGLPSSGKDPGFPSSLKDFGVLITQEGTPKVLENRDKSS